MCGEIQKKKHIDNLGKTKKLAGEACDFECLDGAIVRAQSLGDIMAGQSYKYGIGAGFVLTDSGAHYLAVFSSANLKRGKQGYKVRATKDPLTIQFEDGTELELFAVCDTSTYFTKMHREVNYYCGFCKITREQVESLGEKKISGVKQFIVTGGGELEGQMIEHTEDGRTYIDWAERILRDTKAETYGIAPTLNHKAKCALAIELVR